ncbi:MAG: hypothetical protein PVF51_02620 [Nitrospirota bacterium]|jgi:hypothetical protein
MIARRLRWLALVLLLVLAADGHAQEGGRSISGEVRMGTPGATLGPVDVTLVAPAMGMEEIATVPLVNGRYRFDDIPAGPPILLVQVDYQGVTYRQPARLTGRPLVVNFDVYETTEQWQGVHVEMRHVVLRTDGRVFRVDKAFRVINDGPEKRTVYRDGGAFRVHLPASRTGEVTISVRAQGQPVSRDPVATDEPEVFTVDYPIRPGVTEVELAYTLPYADKQLAYEEPLLYDLPRVDLFVQPADVEVEPDAPLEMVEVNQERNLVYLHAGTAAAGTRIALNLAGGSGVGGGHGQFRVAMTPNRTQKFVPYVVLILGGILAAVAILTAGKEKAVAAATATGGDKQARRLKESLITSIAELDDRLAAGAISRKQYDGRRADLMRKLEKTVRRLGRGPG